MKLKFTISLLIVTLTVFGQQNQNAPVTYITDSGDTMVVPYNARLNPSPPPTPLACASSNNHATPYNQNNGQRGIMFDITALNNITINCFEVNMATGTTNCAIYYKVGTHVGFATTPGAWTLIGTVSVTGAGINVPTNVPLNVNIPVSAGCTVAFYITRTTSGGPILYYTNGTAVGFVYSSNADLQVKDGTGKDYPFAASFTPRRFNGTIFYTLTSGPGGGSVLGPLQVCAGSTQTYTYTGTGWTGFNWTVPAGTTITSGQGTNTITILAGSNPGNICCTPSGPCGPGPQACLAVTLAPSPASTQSAVNISCFGGNTGSATITPNPAGSYTYTWSPNVGSTATVTGLSAGSYTVTATNAGGCSTTQTINVTQPSALTATQSQTNILCNGNSTGAASVSASGGSPGYSYAWSPSGGNGSSATNLAAGAYTCLITDLNGCTNQQTFSITAPPALSLATSSTPSACGNPNGSASVVASGGAGGYQYLWSPSGGTGSTATGLNGGMYSVTVTDVNGCSTQATVNVTTTSAPTATITASTNVLCNGGNTGNATVTPSGGNGPYTYSWSPSGGTGATANNLNAGTYVVTVTDFSGCTATDTVTLTEPSLLTATSSFTNVLCNSGNTGSASVAPSGGAGSYLYAWTPSGGNASNATGLNAQSYTCTITDANGCTNQQTFNITSPSAINLSTSSTPSTCGAPNGSASVVASGGAGGYQYMWSPSGGTGATESALTGGPYVVTVTDANSCTSQATVTVVGASTPTAVITSSTNILCNGDLTGDATVTPSGGNGPYTYSWSPSGGSAATEMNLGTGTYVITVTDFDGCTATDTITLTEPPQLTATATATDVLCFGGNSGNASVTTSGGAGGYQYTWSPSGGNAANATGLNSQSYTCTITDANGCATTASVTITEPSLLTTTFSQVDELCNGGNTGSATVNPSGGAGSYQYSWTPSGGNAATATSLTAGVYTCMVTDANGCILTQTFNITEPSALVLTQGAITNVDCFGNTNGAITVNSSGGSGTYTYTWAPNVSSTNSASSLGAGNYSITITDANGCSTGIPVTVTEPPMLTMQASGAPNSICSGQQVALSANAGGGVPTYTVIWTPGNLTGANQNVAPTSTTTYSAVVTDANGCTAGTTTAVTVNPDPVATLASNITSGCSPVCVNFTDQSTVGNPGVITSWNWDFGDQNTSTQQNPSHCYNAPGVYPVTLTVTTSGGCTQTITMPNYINAFAVPVAAFGSDPQPTTIFNSEIHFTDSSTNASAWVWSFGDVLNSSSTDQNPSFNYGQADCYTVVLTVTSSDGCTDTTSEPVCIEPDVSVYVPNAFTPNGDNNNEIFIPVATGINPDKYEMWIFDRWGNMIFTTRNINEGWDGRVQGYSDICQVDTYVWRIVAWDLSGNMHTLTGSINLVK